jgi:hypothetical protein
MQGAQALLMSDPDPKLKSGRDFGAIERQPSFFIRYSTHSNEVVHYLEQSGFRSIGRRADTGEPNLAPIIETQLDVLDMSVNKSHSHIVKPVSSSQLRLLAEVIDKYSMGQSRVYLSFEFDAISKDMRDEIAKIFNNI